MVGLVLLLLGTIVLASAALLQASGWIGAGLVLGGASLLAAGVGLVSASAHAEHLRVRRGEGSTVSARTAAPTGRGGAGA